MSDSLATRIMRKTWKAVLGEKSWILNNEGFRARERCGLVSRPNYAYGMLRAADCAKYFGHRSVTAIEFGVASGAGLLNMVHLAGLIEAETGIRFHIVGFDTGTGLPTIQGFKDHPEIWNPGDFAMEERDKLVKKLQGRAEIVWGDIAQTVDEFTENIQPSCPIGFVSIDVDIYSGSKAALRCLTGTADKYIPAISMYFDDVSFFFANRWCGELASIAEFNNENELRKIDIDRSLCGRVSLGSNNWHQMMHVCHILDHAARQIPPTRDQLTIKSHYEFMKANFLF
jgi:hypothetical protein